MGIRGANSRDKLTSPNIPVSPAMLDRPLAYNCRSDCGGRVEISVQLRSTSLSQKIALNIQASVERFFAINVTTPNILVSPTMIGRPLAYNSPSDYVGIMEIYVQLGSI